MSVSPSAREHTRSGRAARIVVATVISVIVVSTIATYQTLTGFLRSSQSATGSREIVELLNHVKTLLVDAETGVRGYVITGRPEFLEPYVVAQAALAPTLAKLEPKLSDTPDRTARFRQLADTGAAKMARMKVTSALRDSGGFDAATRAVSDGEGKQIMDAARAQISALQGDEDLRLREHEMRTARELVRAKRLFALLALLTVALLALAAFLVDRDLRRALRDFHAESAARRDSVATMSEHDEQARIVRDSIIDAIITIDERGTMQTVNAATERLFGYSATELVGQNVKMLMPSPYRDEHDGYLANYVGTGTAKIIGIGREVVARRKDGTAFPIDLAVSEARVQHRRLFTGVVRDLTDRQKAQAELKELQRTVEERGRLADIGAVTAQIVHDLGNPIAGLSMQVQRLVRSIQRSERQPATNLLAMGEQILASIRRLDSLLQELRDFARQQRLELTSVDLMKLLSATRDVWQATAAARGVEVRMDVGLTVSSVVADESKLFRVLDNLVKNAIEAIVSRPGEVCLSLTASSSAHHAVRISVSDTGSGIPETVDVFRLFETTKREGSGLGLSIARRIVEAHGGGLSFARLEPHGTVFHIDLPARAVGSS